MSLRTTLVTGGAGFIGSHLCGHLISQGDRVIALDNFDPSYPVSRKERNLTALASTDSFTLEQGDVRNVDKIRATIETNGVDRIAHLAARAGVRPSIDAPTLYYDVNVAGTAAVLEAARATGVQDLVLASSSSVYGDAATPFSEEGTTLRPVSPYAASKRGMEMVAETHARLHGLNALCLRLFTVYGPRQRPNMAIAKFVRRVRRGDPIEMYGDGTSQRDYTFVGDAVRGIGTVLDRAGNLDVDVINVGSNRPAELRTLIDAIGRAVGQEPVVWQSPTQPGDVRVTHAAIDRAQSLLGYEPRVSLEEGLQRYAAWARSSCLADSVTE